MTLWVGINYMGHIEVDIIYGGADIIYRGTDINYMEADIDW